MRMQNKMSVSSVIIISRFTSYVLGWQNKIRMIKSIGSLCGMRGFLFSNLIESEKRDISQTDKLAG